MEQIMIIYAIRECYSVWFHRKRIQLKLRQISVLTPAWLCDLKHDTEPFSALVSLSVK